MNLELNINTEQNSKLAVFESVHKECDCIFKTLKKLKKCFNMLHTKCLLVINKIFGKCQKNNENLSVLPNSFSVKIYNISEGFGFFFHPLTGVKRALKCHNIFA